MTTHRDIRDEDYFMLHTLTSVLIIYVVVRFDLFRSSVVFYS